MNDPDVRKRFDELDAARALGDLSADEQAELAGLIAEHGFESDGELDWIVAGLDSFYAPDDSKSDSALERRVLSAAPSNAKVVSFWKHPALGWAAAACVALAFVFSHRDEPAPSLEDQRQALEERGDTLKLPFAGSGAYSKVSGDVVWLDDGQEGYMALSGLPANDPTKEQYQLWIVDPKRSGAPVDGGVFDVTAASGQVVVPVRAALNVTGPVAFVITVEKPGGVVVSEQEIVAAIAKQS